VSVAPQALSGIRVLELGQLVAGPQCGALLAAFGAEVVKVEPVSGDPLRSWRTCVDGVSLWWLQLARNKRSIGLDLHHPAARDVILRLVEHGRVDVLIENFRPGRLDGWGLDEATLRRASPGLVIVRVSGWGQTGPRAGEPGFANVAEAAAGLRHVTGEPDRPPVRPNLSLGDTIAGTHAALGVLLALRHRDRTGEGQVVDVALTESVLALLEATLGEYSVTGQVRGRTGSRLDGVVPTGTYPCAGDSFVVIGANTDAMFKRLARAIGAEAWVEDPRLSDNAGRSAHADELDQRIAAWTSTRSAGEALAVLRAAEVACGPVVDAAELVNDAQLHARGALESHMLGDGRVLVAPAPVPRLSVTPGQTTSLGPPLAAHTREVLQAWAGYEDAAIDALLASGAVFQGSSRA
jgi:formyl-CoA transferase